MKTDCLASHEVVPGVRAAADRAALLSPLRAALAAVAAAASTGLSAGQFCPGGFPQAHLPLECGAGVVTQFSGVNSNEPVVLLMDFRDPPANSPGNGVNWCAPRFHNEFPVTADTWVSANLGQVFGITLDDDNPPSIYVTCTTTFGSDNPAYQNANTVPLPSSPFGPGGSGAVYRLDGTSGAISVFSTLPNTGPGLGQICFDRGLNVYYVSNFEDGRIYRLSSTGTCLSTFDHISDTVGGCGPEAGDPAGFVPFRERIWAVKTYNGRLYYGLWNEDRGRPAATLANEVWSVALDGSGQFQAGTRQLEISVPSFPLTDWSNPVSDISFSAAGRMMLAERNMLADVGAGNRPAWAQDGHRSRNLEYELVGSNWVPSVRTFWIGTSSGGPGTNAAGGTDYDCEDNLWSTGDQVLVYGNPVLAVYGLQRTPEPGNTIPTIATTGYFIDFDGISTVQSKNRIGDVTVYNGCCGCMTAEVESVECEIGAGGLTGCVTVTVQVTNNSGVPASYVLLPSAQAQPHIIPLVPPLPSGTGEIRTITFQLCNVTPGTTHCVNLVLADSEIEECCTIEVCVDIPECDCLQFSQVSVICNPAGGLLLSFLVTNLTPDVIEHVFIFKPDPPDPNAGILVVPDYFDLTGSPLPPFGTTSIGPIAILGAVPGSTLCLRVSAHTGDLVECCSEELCFEVPDCAPEPTGACCLPDGTCVVVTLAQCLELKGLYIGDGAPCSQCGVLEPVGACCLPDGTCVQVSVFECGNLQGLYLGDGTPCTDCAVLTPIGACCVQGAPCVQTSAVNCAASGGVYLGDGTPCSDCNAPVDGACCIPGGCIITLQVDCDSQGGTWLGPGTSCDDCPVPVDPCDLDVDGVVGITDFLILLSSWGPCAKCQADFDGDGAVGIVDMLALLAQWD